MNNQILNVGNNLSRIQKKLREDNNLSKDIDFNFDFILPYSKAKSISNVKLVIIGQDPTILDKEEKSQKRQKEIKSTLDLENEKGTLRKYCKLICERLEFDIDNEVYATNLCKCIFNEKPAYNGVLDKHSKQWLPLLKEELSIFSDNVIFVTLGQPLIKQLIQTNKKEVSYYWDYCGNTKSNFNFKYCENTENYLQKRLYPLVHQPTWFKNKFYKIHLGDYLKFIVENEKISRNNIRK